MKIGVSPRSALLDANVPLAERLYGYHRLDDPLVAVPKDNNWIIDTESQIKETLKKNHMDLIGQSEKPPEPYKG